MKPGCSASPPPRCARGDRARPAVKEARISAHFFAVSRLVDHVLRVLHRDVFGRATGAGRHLDLVILNLDDALGNICIRGFAGHMLALLDHGKLLRRVNGLDLVPGHGHISGNVAVEGHAAADFAQKLARQLIAVGEDNDIRRRRSAVGALCACTGRAKARPRVSSQHKAQSGGKSRKGAAGKLEIET